MQNYYNTTNETGETLALSNKKAKFQDEIILDFFIKNKNFAYTPEEVHRSVFGFKDVPLTSTRRAISNLTEAGHLLKTETKRIGMYGKAQHCWIYPEKKESNGQITLF